MFVLEGPRSVLCRIDEVFLARLHNSENFQVLFREFPDLLSCLLLSWCSLRCLTLLLSLLRLLGSGWLGLGWSLWLSFLLTTALNLRNLLRNQPDTLIDPLSVLIVRSKLVARLLQKLLLCDKIAFEIGCVALWCRHTRLNIRLDGLLSELERLLAELKEFLLVRFPIPLAQLGHKGEVLDFGLDALHTDHVVGLVELFLELDRVISCDGSCTRHERICFVSALSWCLWRLNNFGRRCLYLRLRLLLCLWVHNQVLLELFHYFFLGSEVL